MSDPSVSANSSSVGVNDPPLLFNSSSTPVISLPTPWRGTDSSDRVWYATHRLGARLMVASGVLGLVGVLAGAPGWLVLFLMCWWAPVAVLYSLACYKRLEKAGTLESS